MMVEVCNEVGWMIEVQERVVLALYISIDDHAASPQALTPIPLWIVVATCVPSIHPYGTLQRSFGVLLVLVVSN